MNATIQQFQDELTAAERRDFEARAAQAGRRPGAHLKSILFGDTASADARPGAATAEGPRGGGRREPGRKVSRQGQTSPQAKPRRSVRKTPTSASSTAP